MVKGKPVEGEACNGEHKSAGTENFPQYCCTKGGKLGPYSNHSVPKDAACFAVDEHDAMQTGKACF
jgi:hypothetical protein